MPEILACGLDIGTMFLQAARDDGQGKIIFNTVRDCFREIPYDNEFEDTLKSQKAHYVRDENNLYVLGKDAYLQAGMAEFGADIRHENMEILKRPMRDGILNPDAPKISLVILRSLMQACIEQDLGPARKDEVLYFSIPANPVDSPINNSFHLKMAEKHLSSLGYHARPLGEGLAVVYAENPKMYPPDEKPIPLTGIGISCLIPGTMIYTKRGIIPIESVHSGDMVLTHRGRWKEVTGVISKHFNGLETSFEVSGFSGEKCTYRFVDNHEIYVNRNGAWKWTGCEEICDGDIVGEPVEKQNRTLNGCVMHTYERTTSSKTIVKKQYEMSGPLYRLIGYFLGDGSLNVERGSIQFDFRNDEKDNIEDVRKISLTSLGKECATVPHGENCTRIYFNSKAICNWFMKNCYENSESQNGKVFPFELSRMSNTDCINLLSGLVRSDGSVNDNEIKFFNTNTRLSMLAKQLFSRLGVAASINCREPRSHEYDGRVISGNKYSWDVSCGANLVIKGLGSIIENIDKESRFPDRIFIDGNFSCGRIRNYKHSEYEGKVYDLQVKDDHSFSGPNLTIHNCGAGMTNFCLAERGLPIDEFSIARSGDWIDTNAARMVGQPKTKILRVKERQLDFNNINDSDEIIQALECYYDELVHYVFGIFADRFRNNRGSIDHPIDVILSGGTASPPGFDARVKNILNKMQLPFEINEVRLAKDMMRTVAKGCYLRAKQTAKKLMAGQELFEKKEEPEDKK